VSLLLVADYLGVFVFAITGALVAQQKEMDIFGFVVLALMPAVGGGTLRDLILDVPVFWMQDTTYLYLALAAALLTFFASRYIHRSRNILLWLDAVGLSVFCVTGASKALAVKGDPTVAVLMGVITAVAGGIVRDVIANESPLVLHREVYATAAFAGSLVFVLLTPYIPAYALVSGLLVALSVRALGIGLNLSLPRGGPPAD
jgi:uncharacterized membrane protein YeiH